MNDATGTEGFMLPEMLRCEPYSPFRSDIWALGVTLFYMVHRKYPYGSGVDNAETLDIMFEDIGRICELDEHGVPIAQQGTTLIKALLRWHAEDRLDNVTDLLAVDWLRKRPVKRGKFFGIFN